MRSGVRYLAVALAAVVAAGACADFSALEDPAFGLPDVEVAQPSFAADVQPMVTKLGGKTLFIGRADFCFIGNADWDVVALIQYPSKKSFLDMINSAEYQAIHHHREAGLEAQVLYALTQASG